jgi:GT2 family glycosyltransferase/glycosyltransferase involved in cell wall biosynthesis
MEAFRRQALIASAANEDAERRLAFAGGLVHSAQVGEQEARLALEVLRNSRAHKLARGYYSLIERIAPSGSRRRRGYVSSTRRLVRLVKRPAPAPALPRLPLATSPTVSIVVPVHGKWEFTEGCLRSLADLRTEHPFEVIVVDDASPDDSRTRLEGVEGVRVVPLDANRGFVGACNAGIEAARGEFVLLLNNDTQVASDWLDPLVEVMDDPTVGLVGSRLVYPDGRLQEAGGIIFSDGSGWNYGKFDNPEDPAYTYRRDVDYVSGASILVRRSVLDALGGLDNALSPAYYDDTDLAFGVRSLGLRVVYEPASVVFHLEGGTHGTDEAVGLKAYQVVNRSKFVAKWADALQEQLAPDPANVQRAARRRNGRGIVVVIDHYLPRPDEDSGSVRMMGLLKALRGLGYGVLFVPDNRYRHEPYSRMLQELGIEVFYGGGHLPAVLGSLADDIVAIIASRVTVAHRYLIDLRTVLPQVPFIFDTVDLHHLREEREAALAGTPAGPRVAAVREFELGLVRAADTTLVVSSFEKAVLKEKAPGSQVAVLPNVHVTVESHAPLEGREGLLFVGSFAHTPNADALRWFTSAVLPLIAERHPGVPVHVVGRDPSPDLVANAPSNVIYHGWVPDLAPMYDQARIVIAPLRYGAGVKGKIGEAMSHGVPVVMTPVGAEGMDIVNGETALIATSAADFADAVDKLLVDDDLWTELSANAREHIEQIFGVEPFERALTDVIAQARAERASRCL